MGLVTDAKRRIKNDYTRSIYEKDYVFDLGNSIDFIRNTNRAF